MGTTTSLSQAGLLKSVLNASSSGVLVYQAMRDAEGNLQDLRLTLCNPVAEDDLGRPAGEAIGQPFSSLYPHLAGTDLLERYGKVMARGVSERFEVEYQRPGGGEPTYCAVSAVGLEDSLVVAYEDITRQKADAREARWARVLEGAFEASLNGITVFEAIRDEQAAIIDFRFVMINEAGLAMSGYTREALRGRTLREIYPATGTHGLFRPFVEVCRTGEPYRGETYYPEYDTWREVLVVKIPDGVMVTYYDTTALHRAGDLARQQAGLLEAVFEGSPNAILVLEAVGDGQTGTIVDFELRQQNNKGRQLLGFSPGQRLSGPLRALFSPLYVDRLVAVVQTGVACTDTLSYTYQGQPRWYDTTVVRSGNGLVITFQDQTARQEAQDQVRRQTQLLGLMGDNIPAGLVLWEGVRSGEDPGQLVDFRYQLSNRVNAYLTGLPAEALAGHSLLELFPHQRGTALEGALREALETGRTQHALFASYFGRPGWYDAQFMRVPPPEGLLSPPPEESVLMTLLDVTESHQAQLNQKQQADLLRTIIDAQPSGVVLFEPVWEPGPKGEPGRIVDFTFVLVNEAELRVTGLKAEEMIGQRQRVLFASPEGGEFFAWLVEVMQTGQPRQWLMPYFSDGIRGWFQSSLVLHGNQVLFTFLDVTELKRQQLALERANYELQQRNDHLRQFTFIASHDLQEPLRKIQTLGEVLAINYGAALDPQGSHFLSRIRSSAERMTRLVEALLSYARLATLQPQRELVPLAEVVAEVLEVLDNQIAECGARIECTELPGVNGDRTQLQLLFLNLLSNALKFCRPGVPPLIRIGCRPVLPDELSSAQAELLLKAVPEEEALACWYEITVTDNGLGFEEQYMDRIFRLFGRLHGPEVYSGTGMGLAICHKVVQNHWGALLARSTPGQGAAFVVYLPQS